MLRLTGQGLSFQQQNVQTGLINHILAMSKSRRARHQRKEAKRLQRKLKNQQLINQAVNMAKNLNFKTVQFIEPQQQQQQQQQLPYIHLLSLQRQNQPVAKLSRRSINSDNDLTRNLLDFSEYYDNEYEEADKKHNAEIQDEREPTEAKTNQSVDDENEENSQGNIPCHQKIFFYVTLIITIP